MSLEDRVYSVVADQFSIELSSVNRETTADDVDGWDSLNHTRLLLRLENELRASIPDHLLFDLNNVGDLIKVLEENGAHG